MAQARADVAAARLESLEPADRRGAKRLGELGVLAEALVGAAPPLVAGDRDARGEGPADSRAGQLQGRDPAGLLDERRVARRPQADVVREDDRPVHVVVPVNRVDPVDDRDLEPALEGP